MYQNKFRNAVTHAVWNWIHDDHYVRSVIEYEAIVSLENAYDLRGGVSDVLPEFVAMSELIEVLKETTSQALSETPTGLEQSMIQSAIDDVCWQELALAVALEAREYVIDTSDSESW